MSIAKMNVADHTLVHAIDAILHSKVSDRADQQILIDIVKEALPHTSDSSNEIRAVIGAGVTLMRMAERPVRDAAEWTGWHFEASLVMRRYHRMKLGDMHSSMHDQIQKARAAA